jgi:NAD(P)-dependent dehydrogenase (short-subunit alcohol dehydrogenase family)
VTGGLGGIGAALAGWLIQRGARYLLLTGRSQQGESAVLGALRRTGAEVTYAQADVADEAIMRRLVEDRHAAGLPPVRGVFHAAGELIYKPVPELSEKDLAAALRPKLVGGLVLDQLFRDADLDHFVLFSSGSAVLPSPHLPRMVPPTPRWMRWRMPAAVVASGPWPSTGASSPRSA